MELKDSLDVFKDTYLKTVPLCDTLAQYIFENFLLFRQGNTEVWRQICLAIKDFTSFEIDHTQLVYLFKESIVLDAVMLQGTTRQQQIFSDLLNLLTGVYSALYENEPPILVRSDFLPQKFYEIPMTNQIIKRKDILFAMNHKYTSQPRCFMISLSQGDLTRATTSYIMSNSSLSSGSNFTITSGALNKEVSIYHHDLLIDKAPKRILPFPARKIRKFHSVTKDRKVPLIKPFVVRDNPFFGFNDEAAHAEEMNAHTSP